MGLPVRDVSALAIDALVGLLESAARADRASSAGPQGGCRAWLSEDLLAGAVAGAISRLQTRTKAALGVARIPAVSWDDVGGLEDAKQAIR